MDETQLLRWTLGGVGVVVSALVSAIVVLFTRREADHKDEVADWKLRLELEQNARDEDAERWREWHVAQDARYSELLEKYHAAIRGQE